MRATLLEGGAQRRAAPEQVLLAHELAQRGGPHARGERLAGEVRGVGTGRRLLRLEELLFHPGEFSQR